LPVLSWGLYYILTGLTQRQARKIVGNLSTCTYLIQLVELGGIAAFRENVPSNSNPVVGSSSGFLDVSRLRSEYIFDKSTFSQTLYNCVSIYIAYKIKSCIPDEPNYAMADNHEMFFGDDTMQSTFQRN